jgi:hypothetical protein
VQVASDEPRRFDLRQSVSVECHIKTSPGHDGHRGLAAADVFNTDKFGLSACGIPRARRIGLRDAAD